MARASWTVLAQLIISIFPNGNAVFDEGPGWPRSLQFLRDTDDATFFHIADALTNMTRLSYTATWGSYYNPSDRFASHPGWLRGELEANPEGGGMRALTFLQESSNPGRGVVVFRGTDLNKSSASGLADTCADQIIAGKKPSADCEVYSNETLDYLARALEFASVVAAAHPDVEWLYTGHSLGAQLAVVVGSVRGSRAVGFSTLPVAAVLRNRTRVDPESVGKWDAVTMYNGWDPIRYVAQQKLVGSQAAWDGEPSPLGCELCDLGPQPPKLESPACELCFAETHVFTFYLKLVASRRRPTFQGVESEYTI